MRDKERGDSERGEPNTDSGHGNNPLESAEGNENATSNEKSEEEERELFFPEGPSDLGLEEYDSNSESESATPREYSEKERDSAQVPETSHSEDAQEHVRQNYNPLATEVPDSFSKSVVAPEVGFKNHGLLSREAMFLRTVIDAYNGHNEYPLELPMSKHLIGPDDGVDAEKLENEGFIKRHYLLNKGQYYTPTPKAQKAVG